MSEAESDTLSAYESVAGNGARIDVGEGEVEFVHHGWRPLPASDTARLERTARTVCEYAERHPDALLSLFIPRGGQGDAYFRAIVDMSITLGRPAMWRPAQPEQRWPHSAPLIWWPNGAYLVIEANP